MKDEGTNVFLSLKHEYDKLKLYEMSYNIHAIK